MTNLEFLIALLIAIAGLARLAGLLRVPFPVVLVLGGLVIGLIPGVPRIELQPDVVLLIFLPPLVYHAAFLSSPRELKNNAWDVGALAIGLVLATLVIVALVAHEVIGHLTWAEAFVLGAIVSPTDPIAATSIFRRLGAPDRLTTIVEGEALVNDGTGLVAFRVAVAAVAGGSFSLLHAGAQFLISGVGGIAVGLVVGWVAKHVRGRLDDPPIEITISLFVPFAAYLPAEHLGVSGVLAAVAAGLFLAYQVPTGLFHAPTRLQAFAFWDVLVFLLNSLLFLLVGLQARPVLSAITKSNSLLFVVGSAVLVTAAVVLTRIVWMFVAGGLAKSFGERVVIAWSGMRGAVSLAAALSVPLNAPGRPLILYLTFAVILGTLVGQGLTLPAVVRRLAPESGDEAIHAEENARAGATRAALDRLSEIAADDSEIPDEALDAARRRYELRLRHFTDAGDGESAPLTEARDVQEDLAETERAAIQQMHADGEIDLETARRLERELDLQEERWAQLRRSPLS